MDQTEAVDQTEVVDPTLVARRKRRRPTPATVLIGVVLVVYAAVMIRNQVAQYDHYAETIDFSFFNQAWHLIAHGDLNPFSSVFSRSYLSDHGEVIMWLVAPLYWLWPNDGLTLLIIQDLAIAGAVGIACSWVLAIGRRRQAPAVVTTAAVVFLLVACVLNPWLYLVTYQDFHFQAVATLLVLAAGRDWYTGHRRRAVVWAALLLCCGDVAATYLVGLGIGFVLTVRGSRRAGAIASVIGLGWVGFLGAVHANAGSALDTYAYMAPTFRVEPGLHGLLHDLKGGLLHPDRPWHVFHQNLHHLEGNLSPEGGVGILEPLLIALLVIVLGVNALSGNGVFILEGFQNTPVYIVAALGVSMLALRIGPGAHWRRWIAVAGTAILLVAVIRYDAIKINDRAYVQYRVSTVAARQLDVVRKTVPDDAEVVSTVGVAGRVSGRHWMYLLSNEPEQLPVKAHTVVFVVAPTAGNQPLPAESVGHAVGWITGTLHATRTYEGSEVSVYVWHPTRLGAVLTVP